MRTICFGLILLCAVQFAAGAEVAGWNDFIIRNSSEGVAPVINDVVVGGVEAKEFVISAGNMKAAWGTSLLDGATVGDITQLGIDRLDDYSRFTTGSGPAVAPYFNIWITDGAGKYAVIANEPSNGEWQPGNTQWDITGWDMLKTKTLKVYETNDKSWLPNSGVGLTFEDVAAFVIQAPTPAELAAGWSGLGTGAPRELGTNAAYGFNWIFGDTLSNYVSGDSGYVVANPVAVPEPLTLLLTVAGGLLAMRRKPR